MTVGARRWLPNEPPSPHGTLSCNDVPVTCQAMLQVSFMCVSNLYVHHIDASKQSDDTVTAGCSCGSATSELDHNDNSKLLYLQHFAHKREAIGMDATRWQANQHVSSHRSAAIDDAVLFHSPHGKAS